MTFSWEVNVEAIIAIISIVFSFGIGFITFRLKTRAVRQMRAGGTRQEALRGATRNYLDPHCDSVDPTGRLVARSEASAPKHLTPTFDEELRSHRGRSAVLLLADSGMGKTTALTNYYVRSTRQWWPRQHVAFFNLGQLDVTSAFGKLPQKSSTILLLDALDEDTAAQRDPRARIRELMEAAREFHAVVISCRSQFFLNDAEIIRSTGVARIEPRRAGQGRSYEFRFIYLVPFSDAQVRTYLRRKYGWWRRHERERAARLVARMHDLAARPLLLSHLDDLSHGDGHIRLSIDAYREIIEAWIKREVEHVGEAAQLQRFSEEMSVDLLLHRRIRGAEHIPADEIPPLAARWDIDLDKWKLTARSLLNRDAAGNYRFAHRSIMEYLVVRQAFDTNWRCFSVDWTDQMFFFAAEFIAANPTAMPQATAEPHGEKLQRNSLDDASPSKSWAHEVRALPLEVAVVVARTLLRGVGLAQNRADRNMEVGFRTRLMPVLEAVTASGNRESCLGLSILDSSADLDAWTRRLSDVNSSNAWGKIPSESLEVAIETLDEGSWGVLRLRHGNENFELCAEYLENASASFSLLGPSDAPGLLARLLVSGDDPKTGNERVIKSACLLRFGTIENVTVQVLASRYWRHVASLGVMSHLYSRGEKPVEGAVQAYVSYDVHDRDVYLLIRTWEGRSGGNDKATVILRDGWDFRSMDAVEIELRLYSKMKGIAAMLLLVGRHSRLSTTIPAEVAMARASDIPIILVNLNGKTDFDEELCPPIVKDEVYTLSIPFVMEAILYALTHFPAQQLADGSRNESHRYQYPDSFYSHWTAEAVDRRTN